MLQVVLLGYTCIVKESGLFFAGTAGIWALAEMACGFIRTDRCGEMRQGCFMILFGSAILILGTLLSLAAIVYGSIWLVKWMRLT